MLKLGALCAALSLTLLAGCSGPTALAPTATTPAATTPPSTQTQAPLEPTLTFAQAQEVVAAYKEATNAALLAANESHDAAVFRDVATGPLLLASEFEVLAFERLERDFEVDESWNHHVGQVWAPAAQDYPRYAFTGSMYTSTADSASTDIGSDDSEPPAEEDGDGEPVDYLIAWVQEEAEGPWRRWGSARVDLRELPAPVVAPIDEALRTAHGVAVDHLVDYVRGKDAPTVTPDEALEAYREFEHTDPEIQFDSYIEPYRNRIDQVGPEGSVLVADLAEGSLGIVALRSSDRSWIEGEGLYLTMNDKDLAVALGVPDRYTARVERRITTIAYLLSDDGRIQVLGSDVAYII